MWEINHGKYQISGLSKIRFAYGDILVVSFAQKTASTEAINYNSF